MKTKFPSIQTQKEHWKALKKETPETPNERSETGNEPSLTTRLTGTYPKPTKRRKTTPAQAQHSSDVVQRCKDAETIAFPHWQAQLVPTSKVDSLIQENADLRDSSQRLADALKNVLDERVGCRVDARKVLEDWSAQ